MNIDFDLAKFMVTTLVSIGAIIYTWIATKDKDNSQHIKAVEEALGKSIATHSSRLDKIETALMHIPTQDELAELQGDMKAVKEAQQSMRTEIETMRKSVDRILDYLLNKDK